MITPPPPPPHPIIRIEEAIISKLNAKCGTTGKTPHWSNHDASELWQIGRIAVLGLPPQDVLLVVSIRVHGLMLQRNVSITSEDPHPSYLEWSAHRDIGYVGIRTLERMLELVRAVEEAIRDVS